MENKQNNQTKAYTKDELQRRYLEAYRESFNVVLWLLSAGREYEAKEYNHRINAVRLFATDYIGIDFDSLMHEEWRIEQELRESGINRIYNTIYRETTKQ